MRFLAAQGRGEDYVPLSADEDAEYDEVLEIDLSALEPLVACPHSPGQCEVRKEPCPAKGRPGVHWKLHEFELYRPDDGGRHAEGPDGAPGGEPHHLAGFAPGAGHARPTALTDLLNAGGACWRLPAGRASAWGRALTPAASRCARSTGISKGAAARDAGVYLVSPETAAASCLTGFVTDPSTLPPVAPVEMPAHFAVNDNMIDLPAPEDSSEQVEVLRGPNIKPLPQALPLTDAMALPCLLKVGDNITTDHIMPAGSKILPYRSNIPYLANFCFEVCDADFAKRAMKAEGGFIVGGANYGQGSSREHAALVPLYLGIRAVIAKSFARIHKANLVNAGILPLEFKHAEDYDKIFLGQRLSLSGIFAGLAGGCVSPDECRDGRNVRACVRYQRASGTNHPRRRPF